MSIILSIKRRMLDPHSALSLKVRAGGRSTDVNFHCSEASHQRHKMKNLESGPPRSMRMPVPMLAEVRTALHRKLIADKEGNEFSAHRGFLDLYRQNSALAKMIEGVLGVRSDWLLYEEELPTFQAAKNMVDRLESQPLRKFNFCSVIWEDEPCGILIEKANLKGGGLIYVTTLFSRGDDAHVIRVEFRLASGQPEPFASMCTPTGWSRYSIGELESLPGLAFLFRCIAGLHARCFLKMPLSEIEMADIGSHRQLKDNEFLTELCQRAYTNQLVCTKAVVPIDMIVPDDMDYCLNYPINEIKKFMSFHVDAGEAVTSLLLYQVDGRFVMGDDYSAYLTYKALLFKFVPAVIMGEFSSSDVRILQRGGGELMPPILITHGRENKPRPVDAMVQLQEKLSILGPEKTSASQIFTKIYLEFCNLLGQRHKREADLHAFLERYPAMLDGHVAKVHSEVRVGRYRADLVFRYEQSDRRILLIELEKDNVQIFTKKNRLRESVGHASQQIEDWIGAIRSNAPEMPEWLKGAYVAEGLVVIGRSSSLDEVQKQTLYNINSNRVVKIVTYDDLLERLSRLIVTLGQVQVE